MKIMWTITGAGHLLKESVNMLDKISESNIVTIVTSNAAQDVISLYGYNSKIKEILENNKENQLITDKQQEYSYPISGKLTQDNYDLIVISPATANTVAKIVHGIADTIVTNIAAQSGKGQIPLLIVPVDQKEGLIKTALPRHIDKNICTIAPDCNAKLHCPADAINPPNIDTLKCINCNECEDACGNNAVKTGKKIDLYIRRTDAQNTKKLDSIENITTIYNIRDILKYIKGED